MKTCSKCKIEKNHSEFHNKAEAKDGFKADCKSCDREWRMANREKLAAKNAKWAKENRDKTRASAAKRRAAKIQRTPAWVDHSAIVAVYTEARRLEALDGIPRHVDHIAPLQGTVVSGFHIASNLQILTAQENLSKSNRFELTN